MFKVGGPILHFFLLGLTVSSNLISNNVYKQPRVSKTLSEKSFKFTPKQKIFGDLVPQFVLVLAKADLAKREKSGKGCLVRTSGTGGGKMIHTLLTEVVVLHVGFTMIEIWEVGFERTFLRAWFRATCLRLENKFM